MSDNRNWRSLATWGLGAALLLSAVFFIGRAILSGGQGPVKLVVYAFSTQEEVLTQSIFPAFEQSWQAETGRDLVIEGVFGPSGTLARQIVLGAPADVAVLSHEQHVKWLKVGRKVEENAQPVEISYSPMVIVTRPGNPAEIADFGDLAQPGLRLLHADPRSSGAGAWGILAEYGDALLESGDVAVAEEQLKATWRNVCLLGSSARSAMTLFELGACDALVTYEQDARLAQERGVPLEILLPPRTIIANHVAVVVDKNVTRSERPAAQAFIDYLLSDAGQQAFVRYQLRPANLESDAFPPLMDSFTVDDLGGWPRVYPELVESLWQTEIEPRLDLEAAPLLLGN